MACFTCWGSNLVKSNKKKTYKLGECRICVGVENDRTLKQVWHCGLCNEWFCDDCTDRYMIRGWEATKALFKYLTG